MTVDLGCTSACAPQPWGQPSPVAITPTALFNAATGVFVAVGDDGQGSTHVLRMDATSTTEVPLKIARNGARAAQTQTGAIVILGGGSATPESCVP